MTDTTDNNANEIIELSDADVIGDGPPSRKAPTGACVASLCIIGCACVFGFVMLLAVLLPVIGSMTHKGRLLQCQRNMRTLGELLVSNSGVLPGPDSLKEDFCIALTFENLRGSPETLICPETADAVGPDWETTAGAPAYRESPRNCSYFGPISEEAYSKIVKPGLNDPIMGEHWTNHKDGFHVIFGDTHVEFFEWEDFARPEGDDPFNAFGRDWSESPVKVDLTTIGGSDL